MRNIILSLLIATSQLAYSQEPPIKSDLSYRLTIGCNATTIVIFPYSIRDVDRGIKDLLTGKVQGFDNVLKLRAAKKDFPLTNLHVFTANGNVYSFQISYIENPLCTTFNLSQIENAGLPDSELIPAAEEQEQKLFSTLSEKAKHVHPFFSKHQTRFQTTLKLQTIHIIDSAFLFGFAIRNNTNISFDIDFIRFYIKDKQKAKRSSIQEVEIKPLFTDTIRSIPAFDKKQIVVAIPKFTIPDEKSFVVELYERNGGRNTSIKIKNRHLLKARRI